MQLSIIIALLFAMVFCQCIDAQDLNRVGLNARLARGERLYLNHKCEEALELYDSIKPYQTKDPVELFWASYRRACCLEILKRPFSLVYDAYMTAIEMRPSRMEPLWGLSRYFLYGTGEHEIAYGFASAAAALPVPLDPDTGEPELGVSLVEWEFNLLDDLAVAAFYLGTVEGYEECIARSTALLKHTQYRSLARENKERLLANIAAAEADYTALTGKELDPPLVDIVASDPEASDDGDDADSMMSERREQRPNEKGNVDDDDGSYVKSSSSFADIQPGTTGYNNDYGGDIASDEAYDAQFFILIGCGFVALCGIAYMAYTVFDGGQTTRHKSH